LNETEGLSQIEKLTARHDLKRFRCGQHGLDYFLSRYALENQRKETSVTYVVHRGSTVVGYYTLAFGTIGLDVVPANIAEGMPPFPVPVMVLAHWAVDRSEQGRGLGKALLKDAFVRTSRAAEIAGLRAILVDAIDDRMAAYYETLGFRACPVGVRKLLIPIAVVRGLVGSSWPRGSESVVRPAME